MSGGMPYYLEKGDMLRRFEDVVNSTEHPDYAARALRALRNPRRDLSKNFLFQKPAPGPNEKGATPSEPEIDTELETHFNDHWLGTPSAAADAEAAETAPDEPSAAPPSPTGWWWAYRGDADPVLRTTLARGLEVALGVPPDEEFEYPTRRHWPIALFWVCGHRWFEGWVTWLQDKERDTGFVIALLATPGFNGGHPLRQEPAKRDDGEVERVTSLPDDRDGLWLVTHENHRQSWKAPHPPNAGPSGSGLWRTPYLTTVDSGEVVVLDVSEEDDGLKRTRQPFIPVEVVKP